MNFCGFCTIVLFCHYLVKAENRLQVFGWICVAFSISVFAAPLSVMVSESLYLTKAKKISKQTFLLTLHSRIKPLALHLSNINLFFLQRTVISTKSVEYMPINLSISLTLTATIWFLYGFVQKDLYITVSPILYI